MTARYAILRQVWGAETTEDLATDTYGTKLKYYMDPTSAHDVSGILKTAGKVRHALDPPLPLVLGRR